MIDRQVAELAVVEDTSAEFLGRWNRLISTTNWEKGKIIFDWRSALVDAGAAAAEFSDEAWARRVGNVSGQHTGRLRRVFERFGVARDTYPGLYWSHFQAGLDWDDAEMWLEGAVQSAWSISEMRRQRYEALGLVASDAEAAESNTAEEFDDGAGDPAEVAAAAALPTTVSEVRDHEGDDDTPWNDGEVDSADDEESEHSSGVAHATEAVPFRPFAELPDLPADLADAFESFKLAILHHRLDGWREISQQGVIGALDSLKLLATAPGE